MTYEIDGIDDLQLARCTNDKTNLQHDKMISLAIDGRTAIEGIEETELADQSS